MTPEVAKAIEGMMAEQREVLPRESQPRRAVPAYRPLAPETAPNEGTRLRVYTARS